MAVITLEKVGKEVNWPAGEAMPRSMREALKLGWEVDGSEGGGPDEYTEVGEAVLCKDVGGIALQIRIPYRSKIKYGRPGSPLARIITGARHFNIVGKTVTELCAEDDGNGTVN